jgi:hypothetical protein
MGEKPIHRPEVFTPQTKKGLPFRGFLLILQYIFDDRKRKEIMILEFFNQTDSFHIAFIIIRGILPALAGLGKKAFADIIMNGFLGNAGALDKVSDFQGITPKAGKRDPKTKNDPCSSSSRRWL